MTDALDPVLAVCFKAWGVGSWSLFERTVRLHYFAAAILRTLV